jgi:hypothetical protein
VANGDWIHDELLNIRDELRELRADMRQIGEDVAALKVKAGVAGGLVGLISSAVVAMVSNIKLH